MCTCVKCCGGGGWRERFIRKFVIFFNFVIVIKKTKVVHRLHKFMFRGDYDV